MSDVEEAVIARCHEHETPHRGNDSNRRSNPD